VKVRQRVQNQQRTFTSRPAWALLLLALFLVLLQFSCYNLCHVCGRNCNHTSHVRVSSS